MSNENEMNQLKKNCIFINQLPPEYLEEACNHFPREHIYHTFPRDEGLYIYFNYESQALTYARRHAIMINGQCFQISLAATNLTVHGVSALLQVHELKNLMESNGYEDIIFVYRVEGIAEHDTHVTFIMNGECRVILDIPEILYNCSSIPIRWPERENFAFKVSFFCRFCRQDGHKSCECSEFSRVESFTGNYRNHECSPANGKKINFGPFHIRGTTTFRGNTISIFSCNSAEPHSSHISYGTNSRAVMSEPHLNMTEHTGSQPESEISNPQGTVNLSEGIIQAIRNVVRNPDSLIIFLNHVRRRQDRKLKEITLAHANDSPENISDLIKKLELIKKNYYRSVVIRGSSEDNDIKYIKNLIERLRNLFPSTTGL